MSDEVTQHESEAQAGRNVSRDDYNWMVQNRNEWKQRAELSEHEKQKTADAERRAWLNYDCAERLKVDLDAARADLEQARNESSKLHAECQRLTADNCRLVDEFNCANLAAEISFRNLRVTIQERDSARTERDAAEAKCQKLHAENEGLRADALAYPPQRLDLQQYANLKADHDRQVIMIETLQEGLKRTETLLAKAQAQHIDDRLKGFLSVISQLADQAQDLLP